jgi:RND family efflux transporter MFP subunit
LRVIFVSLAFLASPVFGTSMAPVPPVVTAKALSSIAVYPERSAQAQVLSRNDSKLSAEIAAKILSIPVQVGQAVKHGAVVAELDCGDFKIAAQRAGAQMEAARARAQLSEMQVKRAQELSRSGFISKDALDARATELKVAQAERDIAAAQSAAAQREVGKCTIRAPFDAVVQHKMGQLGELAAPGTPLLALVDVSQLEVGAELQQKDVESLQQAHTLEFETQGRRYALKLLRVSPVVNLQSRSQEARFAFLKQSAAPGLSGRVVWRDAQAYLPPRYLVSRNGQFGMFVLKDGVARFVPLAGAQQGRPAAAPYAAATLVITGGHLELSEGQRVSVVQ